jgi:hypothetical protein
MQPKYAAEVGISNAGTSTSQRFGQRIEDVRTFAGEVVTLSFWCLSTVAPKTIIAKAVQNFGTGGSPSAAVTTTIGTVTTTTSMVRKSFTFTVPALTGKSIGTAENSYLEIHFELGLQTGSFQFWGVQLEQNSTATALERRPIQQELALCQRYFFRSVANGQYAAFGSGLAPAGNIANVYVKFPQTLRIVNAQVAISNCIVYFNGTSTAAVSILSQYNAADSALVGISTANVFSTGQALILCANAAGSYFEASAEL